MCDHHSLDDCSEIDYTDDSGEDEDFDEGDDSEEDFDSDDYDSGDDDADDIDFSDPSNEGSDENYRFGSVCSLTFYTSPESRDAMKTFVYSEDFGDPLVEDEGDRFRSRIATCATQFDGMYDDPSIVPQKFNPHRYSCHHSFQKHPRIRPRDEPFVEVSLLDFFLFILLATHPSAMIMHDGLYIYIYIN